MASLKIAGKIPALITTLALLAVAGAAQAFVWPNAQLHPRVIINVDQDFQTTYTQHPDWFEKDFLISGLYISNVVYGQSDQAIRDFFEIKDRFLGSNLSIGTYISGTTVLSEPTLTKYPANAVSLEDLSIKMKYLGPWLREPAQKVVDLKDTLSRKELEEGIRLLWLHVSVPIRFIDNAAVHPAVAAMQPWSLYCENIKNLRTIAAALRSNTVFNVFVRPWQLSNEEAKELIDAVGPGNGVALPLPWSKTIKDDKNASGWAVYRYRQMLDAGLAVILIPSDDAPESDLIGWVNTWRLPTDRLYIATPYWEEPYWVQ